MKPLPRFLAALCLWTVVYGLGLFAVPSLGVVHALGDRFPALSSPVFIQFFFLAASLVLIALLGRGKWRDYGFRGVAPRRLIAPVAVAALLELLFVVLMGVVMNLAGGPGGPGVPGGPVGPGGPGVPGPFGGMSFLQTVLTVWIVASTCEEVFYRGLIQGFLEPLKERGFKVFRIPVSPPAAASAVLFGLGHFCLLSVASFPFVVVIVLSCTAVGFVCAYHREKTGSLVPAVAAHMTANIVGFTVPALLRLIAR